MTGRLLRLEPLRATALATLVALASHACGSGTAARNPRVLVAAIATDPGHLNPAITTSGTTHTASELLYDGLAAVIG